MWDDFDEIKLELPQKFGAKIDQSAQKQGLTQTDDYLAQWQWSEEKEREGEAQDVADIVIKELEKLFP